MGDAEVDRKVPDNITELLPADLLREDEKVVLVFKPSRWLIAFFSFRAVVTVLMVAIMVLFAGEWLGLGIWTRVMVVICGVAIVLRLALGLLQWASRVYVLTDARVIRVRGVFTVDIFQCEIEKIQNTFMVLTVMQRILSLGHIGFSTAGTGGVEAVWEHVREPLKIHEQINRMIGSKKADGSPQKSIP